MTRLAHYAAAALFTLAIPANAALTGVDPYHGTCTPETALDDPAIWGKGTRPPPTCVAWLPEWRPEVFERAKGAPLTRLERGALFYRHTRLHDPDRVLFVPLPDVSTVAQPVPPVPVPAPLWLLAGAVGALAMIGSRR